jgi:hypothetical protein
VGQKTHQRVQISNHSKHLSEWYSNKLSYPALMEEDYLLFTSRCIKEFLSISKLKSIELHRTKIHKNM